MAVALAELDPQPVFDACMRQLEGGEKPWFNAEADKPWDITAKAVEMCGGGNGKGKGPPVDPFMERIRAQGEAWNERALAKLAQAKKEKQE